MTFKLIVTLIVVLASEAISGTHHEVHTSFGISHGSQIPRHLLYDGFRFQPFPQTFQTFSAGAPVTVFTNVAPVQQTIPQHLLTGWRSSQYPHPIPSHLISLTQPAPVLIPFTVQQPESVAQPLVQPIQTFTRTQLVSPAVKGRTQIVQNVPVAPVAPVVSQTAPEPLPVSVVSQRESLPLTTSNAFTTQTLTNTQTFSNSPFQTPTKPLNFAPNLPEVQNVQQFVNLSDNTFRQTSTPQQFQQTLQTSDQLVSNTLPETPTTRHQSVTQTMGQTFTEPIAHTLSQPVFTTQVFTTQGQPLTTQAVEPTRIQSSSTTFNP